MNAAARGTSPLVPRSGPASPPVAPGDLFVLRQTAHCPFEWAVVASDGRTPARLLVVPADTHPGTGRADVRIPARAAGGPLSLRCAFAHWVPEPFLRQGVCSGSLDGAEVALAQRRIDDIELGIPTGTPLDREQEDDPEYLEWMSDSVAPAAAALRAAQAEWEAARSGAEISAGRRWPASAWAAAALLVVAAGLSLTTLRLSQRVQQLSQPQFNIPSGEVPFGSPTRGPALDTVVVHLPPDAQQVLLNFVLGPDLAAGGTGRLEIQTPQGAAIWRSPQFQLKIGAEFPVVVSRQQLPGRSYRLALYRQDGQRTDLLEMLNLELAANP